MKLLWSFCFGSGYFLHDKLPLFFALYLVGITLVPTKSINFHKINFHQPIIRIHITNQNKKKANSAKHIKFLSDSFFGFRIKISFPKSHTIYVLIEERNVESWDIYFKLYTKKECALVIGCFFKLFRNVEKCVFLRIPYCPGEKTVFFFSESYSLIESKWIQAIGLRVFSYFGMNKIRIVMFQDV